MLNVGFFKSILLIFFAIKAILTITYYSDAIKIFLVNVPQVFKCSQLMELFVESDRNICFR